jgi:ketosteroid isomerase-like protein
MIGAIMAKKAVQSRFMNLNKNDIDSFMKAWSDDAVFIYPSVVATGGTTKGKENIRKWFANWMKQIPKRNFVLKNVCVKKIFACRGTNVVAAEWDIKITNKDGKDFETNGVTTIDIKNGKAIRVCDYISDIELLKKMWGEE